MKYVNRIVYFLILISLITFQPDVQAKGEISGKGKTQVNKVLGTPQATWFTINNVATILRNDGMSDLNGQDSGFEYPQGSHKTVFYESGFVYGGNFNGEFRIGGSTYNHSQVPGRILDNGTAESADLEHVRIYRVRRDYKDPDADFTNEVAKGGTAASVYAQYEADWNAWPAQYGAPYEDVDGNGSYNPAVDIPGVPGADQTIWFVANDLDPTAQQQFYGTLGLGCEMQATFWGYNSGGALGNAMFRKYTLINKSGVDITDMYVCMWSDPDLGDAGDDYTGCDIDLSLGYIYNGDDNDAQYGVNVPAGGFDFFQGPIVPSPGSQAVFGGEIIDDYRNLEMSAFFFFINGDPVYQDPTLGDPTGAIEFRNLMEGKISTTGVPFVDPTTGLETKFTLSGDPITSRGWVDGIIHRPGDRRLGMVAGTFTMAAGDVQEIVVGQFVAGGTEGVSRLGAVGLLKFYDLELQQAYDNFFEVPPSVKAPIVTATALDGEIVLNWGSRQDIYTQTESYDTLGYKFQGYCIYQLPSASSTIESAKLVETFDVVDLVQSIESQVFDVSSSTITRKFTKFGRNTGIFRNIIIDNDLVRGGVPIVNGTEYYFAVTAYAYNPNPDAVPNVLETPLTVLNVTPQAPNPGNTVVDPGISVTSTHIAGASDGNAYVTVIDPMAVTGNNYEVTFEANPNGSGVVWDLTNKTTGTVLINNAPEGLGWDLTPVVEGLQVRVEGAPLDFKSFQVVSNAAGPLNPIEMGTFAFNNNGFPFLNGSDRPTEAQQVGPAEYGISTGTTSAFDGSYTSFKNRVTQGGARWSRIVPYDFEIRFTAGPNYGFEPNAFVTGAGTGGTLIQVPFELWNIGINTPNNTADDYRLFPYLIDSEGDGQFNFAPIDHIVSGGDNDPETDWFYWVLPADITPGQAGYNAILSDIQANPSAHVYLGPTTAGTDVIRRMVIVNWNGGSVSAANWPANLNQAMVETGTVFRIISTKPNQAGIDKFAFTAPKVDYSLEKAKQDVNMINAFPNPYYGVNPREVNKYQKYITFSHLPQKATLRVFNLAGQLIRTIVKDDSSPFTTWSLSNEADLPVASGLYIVHIDMPELGTTKILKVAIVQEQQILDRF